MTNKKNKNSNYKEEDKVNENGLVEGEDILEEDKNTAPKNTPTKDTPVNDKTKFLNQWNEHFIVFDGLNHKFDIVGDSFVDDVVSTKKATVNDEETNHITYFEINEDNIDKIVEEFKRLKIPFNLW